MSAALLTKLRKRGIFVSRVGDQLEVAGSAEDLTVAAVDYIREHRAALLATFTPPPAPGWPSGVVTAMVEARARVLREAGVSQVEAERQAAEELLPLAGMPAHESARCEFHAWAQRRLPRSYPFRSVDLYRCPACLPGAFARGRLFGKVEVDA
jgi:hypothetical protein